MKKWRIWNDLFLGGHHIHDTSDNDTNTIRNYMVTLLTTVNQSQHTLAYPDKDVEVFQHPNTTPPDLYP